MIARLLPPPPVHPALDLPVPALAQAGCFTRGQARIAGFTDYRQRRLIAGGRWVGVVGPVLVHADQPASPWVRAHAAVLASGRYRAVSHSTAAALWGWPIEDESLHVIRPGGRTHPTLAEHRLPLAPDDALPLHGIRVTTLPRTLCDVMTATAFRPAVAAVADGLRRGLFTTADLDVAARRASRRTGAGRARELAHSCRGRPFSILEWDFHQVAWSIDDDGWQFNVPIHDEHGLIGYVDALHVPTGTVVELDGLAFHADRFQQDRSRDQRLACLGLVCVRLTHADLAHRLLVAARLRQILAARPVDPRFGRLVALSPSARGGSGPISDSGFTRMGPDRGWP